MKELVKIYDAYKKFDGEIVPIKINWSSIGAVSIEEAQQFCWELQHKIVEARKRKDEEFVSDSVCMNMLKEYSKKLGLKQPITLSTLIESHQYLREQNQKSNEQRNEEIKKQLENLKQIQLNDDWIRIDTLRKMSIQELSDLLGN